MKDFAGNEDRQIVIIDNIIDKQTPVVKPENPSTPEQSQGSGTPSQAPSTGDAAPVALYAILMLAALVSVTGCVVRKRKAD